MIDQQLHLSPEIATEVMIEMSDPRSSHFAQMRHETLPADHLFGRRVELLTLAVLSQLEADANWHRIAREWMYGDDPVTELGREARGSRLPSRLPATIACQPLESAAVVVPGLPEGRPAVTPTRSPVFTQPSSTARATAAAISSSVVSKRRIDAACTPHISPQRRTVSRPGESA